MKRTFKIYFLFLFAAFSFQFYENLSPALSGYSKDLRKVNAGKANITIDAFTSDDSSKVVKYVANLKDANNNIIKTAYPDSNRVVFKDLPTPVENEKNTIPQDFMLYQNYPNPFNPSTKIQFDISRQGSVRLDVYDILGKHVKTLVNGELNAGKYEAVWGTDNDNGETVAQGVYIYRLIAGDKSISKKMVDLGSAKGTSSFRQLGESEISGLEKSLSENNVMNADYTVEIAPTDSTNPQILTKLISLVLSGDTAFNAYIDRKPIPTRTISGLLTDDEGNVKSGYILAYNANGDSAVAMAGIDGIFSITTNSSNGDTLKAQIYNPNHAEGFIRKIYVAGGNDTSNVAVDAVPLLADSAYIDPNVLGSFAWEANFDPLAGGWGNGFEGLKKANLDSMKEIISSTSWVAGDTIKANEQDYIINIIGQRIDPYFKKASSKHKVLEDSVMTTFDHNAINWFKNTHGAVGSIGTHDYNNDGIIDDAVISLLYIINIIGQDTVHNPAIVQEGLSARIAPGEVGFTSTIQPSQTVLHKNGSSLRQLQPADIWLVKIAEGYAPKTSYYALLTTGNLQQTYDRLKK